MRKPSFKIDGLFRFDFGLVILGAALLLSGCTLFKPTLAPTDIHSDHPPKIYEQQARKKAHIRLRNGTESVNLKVTGDSILIQIIAPENARIKVKGRKKSKRQHPVEDINKQS